MWWNMRKNEQWHFKYTQKMTKASDLPIVRGRWPSNMIWCYSLHFDKRMRSMAEWDVHVLFRLVILIPQNDKPTSKFKKMTLQIGHPCLLSWYLIERRWKQSEWRTCHRHEVCFEQKNDLSFFTMKMSDFTYIHYYIL